MCGIAGFWELDHQASKDKVHAMCQAIRHRGPDAEGLYTSGPLALGHRRLSILDLSEGANQPYSSPCGRFKLVFNGEIFNYQDFYPELRIKGYTFTTTSDTEVLLYLLMEYGVQCLSRLNGFFAFAFWDNQDQSLLLARDRYGVKPLFFAQNNSCFFFASEPKAIFAGGFLRKLDESQVDELMFYRYVSGENTVFSGIKRLLPGFWMKLNGHPSNQIFRRWYHLGEEAKSHSKIGNTTEWFEETFLDSVKLRMIADVKVGTLLSGGLDSSSVLFAQHEKGFSGLSSWNVMFKGFKHDESTIAERFSRELDVEFNGIDFADDRQSGLLMEAIRFNDEPIVHYTDSVLLGLSRKAKEKVTVLLSGEGADEILGGYVRYKPHDGPLRYSLLKLIRFIPDKYLKSPRLIKLKRYCLTNNQDFQLLMNANDIYLHDFEKLGILTANLLPDYRVKVLEEAKELYPKNAYRQLMYLEQHTHLQSLNDKNDRTSMGASIECREPFQDFRLVNGVASLDDSNFRSGGKGKWLLMETVGKKLPEYITKHPKVGMAMPWDEYILNNPIFREHLEKMPDSDFFKHSFLQYVDVKELRDQFVRNPAANFGFIKQLFFNSLWYELTFQKSTSTQAIFSC